MCAGSAMGSVMSVVTARGGCAGEPGAEGLARELRGGIEERALHAGARHGLFVEAAVQQLGDRSAQLAVLAVLPSWPVSVAVMRCAGGVQLRQELGLVLGGDGGQRSRFAQAHHAASVRGASTPTCTRAARVVSMRPVAITKGSIRGTLRADTESC
jgi:hypothetical protein